MGRFSGMFVTSPSETEGRLPIAQPTAKENKHEPEAAMDSGEGSDADSEEEELKLKQDFGRSRFNLNGK